ncbi:MAG: hypothetical protein M0036_19185 [Desulfobacteraceae bacterium]|nr:hypothetical protein [Desulfobacteraceae bacterium]
MKTKEYYARHEWGKKLHVVDAVFETWCENTIMSPIVFPEVRVEWEKGTLSLIVPVDKISEKLSWL